MSNETGRKQLVAGILAHVDAGKTTLSEGMLYQSGRLKRLGRVDHRDAFLDTETLERERGITIFSKQAVLPLEKMTLTLLDTPGHVDFSSEMERTLQVLDYAILVISGIDGVQGHTRTLWRLLERYQIPTFLFINKMDLPGPGREALMRELAGLGGGFVDFGTDGEAFWESVALCGEDALAQYLEQGEVGEELVASLISRRALFPCYFGSALRLEGVDAFLDGLERYTRCPSYPQEFGARVFKIARDPQGNRLTYMKITGGSLRVKSLLLTRPAASPAEKPLEEKADQLRLYSGAKYQTADEVFAGAVCAVTGLSASFPGQGLGFETAPEPPALEPVLTYRVEPPEGCDPHDLLLKLRQLEEEDPLLRLVWNETLGEIHVQLMGEVQLEVLERLIHDRFGLAATFGEGGIVYKETIAGPVEGIGHFEPLRHYAEVHLLLEPGERGSGLALAADCPEEVLERSWQRLVISQLEEEMPPGVLTGSPLTDLRITLVAGRAHLKHTGGGDFLQAARRALRQGLMQAECVLLEPWYRFQLEVPAGYVGRALSDLRRMSARVSPPEGEGDERLLTGEAPVALLRGYAREVAAYTRGQGRLFCSSGGYAPCHNQADVVSAIGYDARRDVEHPADSVFCAHGSGFIVPWDQVREHCHVECLDFGAPPDDVDGQAPGGAASAGKARGEPGASLVGAPEFDGELKAIFERTYGPVGRKAFLPQREPPVQAEPDKSSSPQTGEEVLLVDGYNVIFAWEELKGLARESLGAARQALMDLLSDYQGVRGGKVILVFDAYRVPRGGGAHFRYHNIDVVYTREAETADAYIGKITGEIGGARRVRVASSDGAEQLIILGHGAARLSARLFHEEVRRATGEIRAVIDALTEKNRRKGRSRPIQAAMEKAGEE